MTTNLGEDEAWRVLLLHGLDAGTAASIKSFTLPDPRTGRPQGFLLVNGALLEVNRFKQAYSAWLAGDRLLADGGVFLGTPYDPLFLLLPLLDRARDKDEACPAGKYKELDELLYDSLTPGFSELLQGARSSTSSVAVAVTVGASDGATSSGGDAEPSGVPSAEQADGQPATPEGAAPATTAAAPADIVCAATVSRPPACPSLRDLQKQLACICDVQQVDETCYYRLNDQRVLAWLLCKYRQMQSALAPQVAGMEPAHAAAYVLAFLGEYVGEAWTAKVAKHLGISEKPLGGINATMTAAAGSTLQPTDGNTVLGVQRTPPSALAGPPEKKQKVDPRAAAKQAALAKQAVGTKKLTSFFSKK